MVIVGSIPAADFLSHSSAPKSMAFICLGSVLTIGSNLPIKPDGMSWMRNGRALESAGAFQFLKGANIGGDTARAQFRSSASELLVQR